MSDDGWVFETANSTYLVDDDERTVTRTPKDGGGALRGDGEAIPYRDIDTPIVGRSMSMVLSLVDGRATHRVTSPVTRIRWEGGE